MSARRRTRLTIAAAASPCFAGWEHFCAVGVFGPIGASAGANPPRLAFWERVPTPVQTYLADDIKLLIGWTFDAAASEKRPAVGEIVAGRRARRAEVMRPRLPLSREAARSGRWASTGYPRGSHSGAS